MPVCVLFVSSRSGIVFNSSAGQALTIANQQRTSTHILSPSSVENPGHRRPVLILPNGLSKLGERAHDRNLNFCRGWDSHSQHLDRQFSVLPMSNHRPPLCRSACVCLSVHLSGWLSACLSVFLSIHLPICPSLSVWQSICMSMYMSVCVYVHLSGCSSACLSVALSTCQFVISLSVCCQSVCLFVCLSVFLSCL